MALRRITKELREWKALESDLVGNENMMSASPISEEREDLFKWEAKFTIADPKSPYFGGTFFLTISLPQEYPFKIPKVRFVNKVFHPNLNEGGYVSLKVLDVTHWTPRNTIKAIIEEIIRVMSTGADGLIFAGDYPLNAAAEKMLSENEKEFFKKAAYMTNKCAKRQIHSFWIRELGKSRMKKCLDVWNVNYLVMRYIPFYLTEDQKFGKN